MLSKGVRNLLSLQKRFIHLGSSSWITKPQYGLFNNKNNRNNNDEQDDNANTPEGFSKFKRRQKKQVDQKSEHTKETKADENEEEIKEESEDKDNKPSTGVSFRKQNRKPKKTVVNAEENESKKKEVQDDDNKELDDKKKDEGESGQKSWEFTYKPKIFSNNEKKEEKQEKNKDEKEENDQDESEKKKDQKKDDGKGKNNEEQTFQQRLNEFFSKRNSKAILVAAVIALVGPALYYSYEQSLFISYSDFLQSYLYTDNVRSIQIQRNNVGNSLKTQAKILTKDNKRKIITVGNVDNFLSQLEQYQVQQGKKLEQFIPVSFEYLVDTNKMEHKFSWVTTFFMIGIGYFMFKYMRQTLGQLKGGQGGNNVFGMGKSNVKVFGIDSKVTTRFKDVAGQDEAKQEIQEFVDFLKKPQKYKTIGAKLPRGALLTGPPGTGKTLLAKACAGEAGVPFFFISGSDFVEMFVGVGASRVRDLFKQAKSKSPSIIFIDEIDAVGRKREGKQGGNDERDNTLNQLLVEMDGFGTDANVIVLAATNRKELLDPALTRPGRFDRQIEINNPDIDGRKQIFMIHLKPLKLHPSKTMDEYAKRLATLTPGFSGADIMNLCNEAAILAARKNKKTVESIDFELASERVIAGLEKKKIVSEEERKIVAVHESGHAIVSWFLEGGYPLLKLTIIPRAKGSLGFAQYLPNESSLESKNELMDRLCMILGGRCAEEEFFGSITTGAYDDLKRGYELCHQMVTKYGMSEKLGYVGYVEGEYSKTYSIHTNTMIDEEISRFIQEATERTRQLVRQYRSQIESLSGELLEKETLDLRQITKILGDRPFTPKSNYKAYLELQKEDEVEATHQKEEQPAETNNEETTNEEGENQNKDEQNENPKETQDSTADQDSKQSK